MAKGHPDAGTKRSPGGGGRRTLWFVLAAVVFLFFLRSITLITDWFWFQEVGYEGVFLKTLWTQIAAGGVFGGAVFVLCLANLLLAVRWSGQTLYRSGTTPLVPWAVDARSVQALALAFSLVFAVLTALQGAAQWEAILKFSHGTPFRITDPLFGRDIGFYIFQLPFLRFVYQELITCVFLTGLATAALYFLRQAVVFLPPKTLHMAQAVKAHLAFLAATLLFVAAFGYWLDLNELLFSKRGVVFGPGYTDVTTQVWVLRALVVLAVLAGLGFLSFLVVPNWRISAILLLVFAVVLVAGRGVVPSLVQKLKVLPNEIVLEKPYLERNIHFTRMAYRLEDIEMQDFPAENSLSRQDLKRNDLTVKNIRLWEHAPLLRTYAQLQEIRTYYKFNDVDNDRYMINGEYRQVMLSPRELSYASLPSRTWVNEHLNYTHGYGVVMGPVNRISQEGLPEFFIKDIPPVSSADIRVARPEIYYDETANDYVFVKTKRPEFDYPVGDKNVYARYAGEGGVRLSFWRKLLFSVRFGSLTLLLSDDITSESRVMFYRRIQERVSRILPFVRLDADPYLVLSPEGRLLWFLDGYTVTDRYPYSEPIPGMGNYIRNAVKATVDAYDGTVRLYMSDPSDPLIQTYARIFPGVFRNLADMPEALQRHVRYPPEMLSIQARMFRAYHMEDPQVFYNKEDLWTIPVSATGGGKQEMAPYYTIMRLPEGEKEEFILLLPFTPSKKDNMAAWMAARCDAPHYGKVIVYQFPKQKLIYGPRQIEARIDQDTEISQQITLWSQGGSQVLRGSLLAIPIEQSILYVQSLYLAAEKGQLPELKRVIVAFGNAIAMEENLDLSLQRIFGGETGREGEVGKTAAAPPAGAAARTDRAMALEALGHYRKAQEHLKQGNWAAYGESLRKMDESLRAVERRP